MNAEEHVLFFQCHSYSFHKKTVSPTWKSVPKIIITDRRSLLSLCTWLILFGLIVNKLLPIVANDVKNVSPIMHCLGILSFALSIEVTKLCQYFIAGMSIIETITNVSTNFYNTRIHGSCKNWRPFSPE